MKKKDLAGIRNKTRKELKSLAEKKAVELAKAKVSIKSGQEKNLKKVKLIRHEISQLQTVLREKEIVEKLEKIIERKVNTEKKERGTKTQKK